MLQRLSDIDKHWSEKLHRNDNTLLEVTIFCIPAHMFNRWILLVPGALCILLGAFNYDQMLATNGYALVGQINDDRRLKYGFCLFILYGISLLMMFCITQLMKKTIRRERPTRRNDVTRVSQLRDKEDGTFSMPSGDASAAAVWIAIISMEMGWPALYILMPLVMLGRVYYQCHWLGDTIVGLFVGTFFGLVGVSNFDFFVPLF